MAIGAVLLENLLPERAVGFGGDHILRQRQMRHARAGTVVIHLYNDDASPADLVVEVKDDGVGFDPDAVGEGHFGLITMRERAEALGAAFDAHFEFAPIVEEKLEKPLVLNPPPLPTQPVSDCQVPPGPLVVKSVPPAAVMKGSSAG